MAAEDTIHRAHAPGPRALARISHTPADGADFPLAQVCADWIVATVRGSDLRWSARGHDPEVHTWVEDGFSGQPTYVTSPSVTISHWQGRAAGDLSQAPDAPARAVTRFESDGCLIWMRVTCQSCRLQERAGVVGHQSSYDPFRQALKNPQKKLKLPRESSMTTPLYDKIIYKWGRQSGLKYSIVRPYKTRQRDWRQ